MKQDIKQERLWGLHLNHLRADSIVKMCPLTDWRGGVDKIRRIDSLMSHPYWSKLFQKIHF